MQSVYFSILQGGAPLTHLLNRRVTVGTTKDSIGALKEAAVVLR